MRCVRSGCQNWNTDGIKTCGVFPTFFFYLSLPIPQTTQTLLSSNIFVNLCYVHLLMQKHPTNSTKTPLPLYISVLFELTNVIAKQSSSNANHHNNNYYSYSYYSQAQKNAVAGVTQLPEDPSESYHLHCSIHFFFPSSIVIVCISIACAIVLFPLPKPYKCCVLCDSLCVACSVHVLHPTISTTLSLSLPSDLSLLFSLSSFSIYQHLYKVSHSQLTEYLFFSSLSFYFSSSRNIRASLSH